MLDKVSNKEISNALDNLIACLGVKEEIDSHDIDTLLRNQDMEGCVQNIATLLGLPIRVTMSYVPKGSKPSNTNRFRSSALVETDWTGSSIEGITAQVCIPENLPMFGMLGLQGYPIQVRVSEDCHAHSDTFVAIMAHELSHVLLASLRSPYKDSELHTELVPIILGFREVVSRGRKKIKKTTSGNTTTTQTTTYGYFTDSQFEFVSDYVTGLLQRYSQDKKRLLKVVEQIQSKLRVATRSLVTFREYFRYLDIQRPKKMCKEHAERLVQLHEQDYSLEWENLITAVMKSMEFAEAFARPQTHYLPSAVEHIKSQIRIIEEASKKLDFVTEAITKDEGMLRKYVGIIYRLRRTLRCHS